MMIGGMHTSIAPAAIRLLFVKNSPDRLLRAVVIGRFAPVSMRNRAQKKSLYSNLNSSVARSARTGRHSVRITLHQMRKTFAPATIAYSLIALGIGFM